MFVVTLSKASVKKLGVGAMCCALVVFSAMLGRFISTRTVAVAAPVNRIESAQDIQTWFTGYGLEVDGASITADNSAVVAKCFEVIAKLAAQEGLTGGYRVISNVGEDAGQTVKHLHFHVLGGEKLPV